MIERRGLAADIAQSGSFGLVLAIGLGLLQLDARSARQKTQRIHESHIVELLDVGDGISPFTASEAVPGLRGRIDLA